MANNVNGQRHDRSALILYGSETGNSQDVAEELGRVAERLHFKTWVTEMDAVELKLLLRFTIVIFVVSTTGQGEFPKNAQKFWKSLLRKRLPPDCLGHVSCTTFGLGDSSYAQFNYAARKLHKRLQQLGAKEIYPRGEADDRHDEGIDGTFLSWSADFSKRLLSTFPLPEGSEPIPAEVLLPPKILLSLREERQESQGARLSNTTTSESRQSSTLDLEPKTTRDPAQHSAFEITEPNPRRIAQDRIMLYEPLEEEDVKVPDGPACPMLKDKFMEEPETVDLKLPSPKMLPLKDGVCVRLVMNKRITPKNHWQDVRQLLFLVEHGFDYYVGDTMTIYPKNFPDDVQAVIDLMDWNDIADKPVLLNSGTFRDLGAEMALNNAPDEPCILAGSSLRDLLTHNLDITAIPKRRFFHLAANHTDDPVHKARLFEFASVAYTDEYYDYATRSRRSILEVLQDFTTVKFPFQWVFAVFPLIHGRKYSISSSPKRESSSGKHLELELVVALVKYKTVLKKVRQGLCSRYIDSLQPNTLLKTNLSSTPLNSPWLLNSEKLEHLAYPTICVAPGTGIAPIRSLIWNRALIEHHRRDRTSDFIDFPVGKTILFFGGRNRKMDFFFEDEFKNGESLLVQTFTAFSRDQEKKIYVQDVIREKGQLVTDLILRQDARIFVCGSSGNMPKAVRAAIVDVIQLWDQQQRGREFAEAVVANLERLGRYVQETW